MKNKTKDVTLSVCEKEHPGINNLSQFSNPQLHAAKLAERNRSNPPSMIHGLRCFEKTRSVRCMKTTCPLPGEYKDDTCEYKSTGNSCRVMEVFIENRTNELKALQWVTHNDYPVVNAMVAYEALKILCEGQIVRAGLFRRKNFDGAPKVILDTYMRSLRGIVDTAEKLAMTPTSRLKLGIDMLNIAAKK